MYHFLCIQPYTGWLCAEKFCRIYCYIWIYMAWKYVLKAQYIEEYHNNDNAKYTILFIRLVGSEQYEHIHIHTYTCLDCLSVSCTHNGTCKHTLMRNCTISLNSQYRMVEFCYWGDDCVWCVVCCWCAGAFQFIPIVACMFGTFY